MNLSDDDRFTAYIGLDWANAKHDVCIQAADNEQYEFGVVPASLPQPFRFISNRLTSIGNVIKANTQARYLRARYRGKLEK